MQDDEGIKHESKTVATCGETDPPKAQHYPVSIYLPQTALEEYRADRQENRRRDDFRKRLEIAALLVAAFYAIVTYRMSRAMIDANDLARRNFEASERPYVIMSSRDGGEFATFGPTIADDRKVIVLHFFNVGRSTASHFTVHVYGERQQETPSVIVHRHRWKDPSDNLIGELGSPDRDLGPQAQHDEYITDPKLLPTAKQLAPNCPALMDFAKCFPIYHGEIEYCDAFGHWHCDEFFTEYEQTPIPKFTGGWHRRGPGPGCIREPLSGADAQLSGATEIEPCEQPGEPEYQRQTKKTPRPSPTR